ncbi:MAG: hypothetical protein ACKVVP_16325, partial [Chloroflexota bacterium]
PPHHRGIPELDPPSCTWLIQTHTITPALSAELLLAAVFAPGRACRYTLPGGTAIESVTFISVLYIWLSRIA